MGLIFTYLMTYGGAAASLLNPFIGLLIYICFAIMRPDALWHWSVPAGGNYSRIIAIALLVGWALNGFGNASFGRARGIVFCLVGFWSWMLLSYVVTPVDWAYVESIAKIVLPVVVGVTLVDTIAKVRMIAWVILLSQGYLAMEWNRGYFGGNNLLQEYGFGGMDNNCVAIALATVTGLAFFLCFETPRLWAKGIAFACGAFILHAVMFTFSRGGLLGLIVTGIVGFFLIPKQPKHYFLFAVVILLGLRLAGPGVRDRFMTSFADEEQRDVSSRNRILAWKACLGMMAEQPLFGVGPSQFAPNSVQHYGGTGMQAHTLWLQTGAELGIPGLAFLVSFYGLCIWKMIGLIRQKDADPAVSNLARMVIASLVGFVVSAQFVSLSGLEVPYYVALAGAGLLNVKPQEVEEDTEDIGENWETDTFQSALETP